jgi:hypothetical protein
LTSISMEALQSYQDLSPNPAWLLRRGVKECAQMVACWVKGIRRQTMKTDGRL